MNSREKGKRYEREIANHFRSRGFDGARRGQQYCGANGDADVVGVPYVHIECKDREKLNIYEAMEQAKSEAKDNELAVVIHKRNGKPSLVTMLLDEWSDMFEVYKRGMDERYPSRRKLYEAAGFPHWHDKWAAFEEEEQEGE